MADAIRRVLCCLKCATNDNPSTIADGRQVSAESRCGAVVLGRAYLFAVPFDWRCTLIRYRKSMIPFLETCLGIGPNPQ